MHTFWQDLRYGARMLQKKPAFTAVALVALALGIGANTAIFSVVNALLLRPLPFKDPDRLVYVWETNPKIGLDRGIVSPPDFADWREQNRVFEHISAWRTWFYRLSGNGEPVSSSMWSIRSQNPTLASSPMHWPRTTHRLCGCWVSIPRKARATSSASQTAYFWSTLIRTS